MSYRLDLQILFIALLSLPFLSPDARAEFIQTKPGMYQSTDGQVVAVISRDEQAQGIFFFRSTEPIPIQAFDPERLSPENVAHVFVGFEATEERPYSTIRIGNTSYKVLGNLTIWLDDAGRSRIDVDNSNPYLTLIHSSSAPAEESLLGFYGITEVVRGSGELSAVLAANQLNASIAKVIKPYTLGQSALMFGNRPLRRPHVGLAIERNHTCLSQTSLFISDIQLKKVRQQRSVSEKASLLNKMLEANQKRFPLNGYLTLRSINDKANSEVIALDIVSKNVVRVSPLKNDVTFGGRSQPVCLIESMS